MVAPEFAHIVPEGKTMRHTITEVTVQLEDGSTKTFQGAGVLHDITTENRVQKLGTTHYINLFLHVPKTEGQSK